jgi:hypothetical protein
MLPTGRDRETLFLCKAVLLDCDVLYKTTRRVLNTIRDIRNIRYYAIYGAPVSSLQDIY